MIDITAEIFKGQMGSIRDIMELYSLKEIAEFRDVRIERKKKEEEERQKEEALEQKRREFREAQMRRSHR